MHWPPTPTARPVIPRVRLVITFVVLAVVFFVVIFDLVVERQLRVPLQIWAESKLTNMATLAITKAAESALRAGAANGDLIRPLNSTGGISGLSYAWADLLGIKVAVTEAVIEAVESVTHDTIPVPMGELTGITLFAAHGPSVPVRIIPVGSVTTDMRFDFQAKGINQVLHRIYVDIQVRIRVVAPFTGTDISVHEQIPVTTELIQGSVPNAIINWSGSIDELRSAVPGNSAAR